MNRTASEELIKKIPYNKVESFPDPFTKTPLKDISDKNKARIIFALAYELEKNSFLVRKIAGDLILQNWPVEGSQ